MMKIAFTRKTGKTHHLNYSTLMKKTCHIETAKLVSNSAARWRAIQIIQENNIQRSNKEERYTEKKTLIVSAQEKTPQHKSTQLQSITLTFSTKLKSSNKNIILQQHTLQQERPNDRKKLYEANHLCWWIAIIKKKSARKPPPQNIFHP